MKNIVLIGMPGVGKSTIGVILAKILGYQFIDTDLLIQEEENRLLSEIIEQEGTDGFIAIENRINSRINTKQTIIATGGSVIYGKQAMAHLQKIGTVIYLKLDYESLSLRLSNIKNRGVVFTEGQSLHDLFLERTPLYEKYAHIIVEEDNSNAEETIEKILHALGRKQS